MKRPVKCDVGTWLAAWAVLLLAQVGLAHAEPHPGAVRLWDTMAPLNSRDDMKQRKGWQPAGPSSSGRLQGNLVVEADGIVAGFASRLGEVLISNAAGSSQGAAVRPAELLGQQAFLSGTTFAEQDGVVMAEAEFRAPGGASIPITFTFKGDLIVSVRPEGSTRGVSISAPMELALVPSFVGDDLIYDPKDYPATEALSLPSEHFLLGLLEGEKGMLVMTWQEGLPEVRLDLTPGVRAGERGIEAVSLLGGKGVSLAVLGAPGIWHRERLDSSFLERDVAIRWQPPFPATWLTQLYEDEVKTTFEFRREKEEHWRGGIGSYTLPVWFSEGGPVFSLGKQIVPEGEAIIYFLERDWGTPEEVVTPIEVAERSLAGDVRIGVLDVEGRPTWWPMRPDWAIGGETCNVTDVLKEIFDDGQEVEKRLFVRAGAEDMVFHLEVMFDRNGRYYPFATEMLAYLDAQAEAKPELASYLNEMRGIAQQMIFLYDSARDTLRDMDYARKLEAKTIALAAEKRPDNAQRMVELKEQWIGMGGAAEELSRMEHTLARKLYQQAAYRAATDPAAMPIAEEIRRRTKQCLRRPDSYEMWVND
ncbi:MAG: hypothetical protein ACE149_15900 [Armatimonadota bacterium]